MASRFKVNAEGVWYDETDLGLPDDMSMTSYGCLRGRAVQIKDKLGRYIDITVLFHRSDGSLKMIRRPCHGVDAGCTCHGHDSYRKDPWQVASFIAGSAATEL